VKHTSEWVIDVDHGFVFPQRPLFNKSAAERHWELLSSMFNRTLRNS
jgi:carboxymethylenebutenolidase